MVSSLAVYSGRLMVGALSIEDDIEQVGIAAWDGSHYNGLCEALDGPIQSMAPAPDALIVAGGFHNFGTMPSTASPTL